MSTLARFVTSHGKRIEVRTLPTKARRRIAVKRKPFKIAWVKLPNYWIEQLRQAHHLGTYTLALHILKEDFKRQYVGGDIVLSTAATGLPRVTRYRATKEMIGLGLIRIQQNGRQAVRVVQLFYRKPKRARSNNPDVVRCSVYVTQRSV